MDIDVIPTWKESVSEELKILMQVAKKEGINPNFIVKIKNWESNQTCPYFFGFNPNGGSSIKCELGRTPYIPAKCSFDPSIFRCMSDIVILKAPDGINNFYSMIERIYTMYKPRISDYVKQKIQSDNNFNQEIFQWN